MPRNPTSHQSPSPPPVLKQPAFAFPFRRNAQGNAGASAEFADEHDIYRLLAAREPSGAYLVSRRGMWHGGIHITEGGAGQALDLDAGLRCIADGVLIAYRVNRAYPVSEVAPGGGNAPFQAPYSTGFALVRHEMEFPRGTKLTFYSLYMHLMSSDDYDRNFPKRQKPAYWTRHWQITQHALDRPLPGRSGQVADPSQVGLGVRSAPNGSVLGILPQGASVSIGRRQTMHGSTWGQLTALNGAALHAPVTGGYVAPAAAIDGWIDLGERNGGPPAKESLADAIFDRVVVTTNHACSLGDPHGTGGGIAVRAGDLIGHPGRYDPLTERTAGTRMAHIEVFCDGGIQPFIDAGRNWIDANPAHRTKWREAGLSPEPAILRVDRGTSLYRTHANGQARPRAETDRCDPGLSVCRAAARCRSQVHGTGAGQRRGTTALVEGRQRRCTPQSGQRMGTRAELRGRPRDARVRAKLDRLRVSRRRTRPDAYHFCDRRRLCGLCDGQRDARCGFACEAQSADGRDLPRRVSGGRRPARGGRSLQRGTQRPCRRLSVGRVSRVADDCEARKRVGQSGKVAGAGERNRETHRTETRA